MFKRFAKIASAFVLVFCSVLFAQNERPVVIPPGEFSLLLIDEVNKYANEYLEQNGMPANEKTLSEYVKKKIVDAHPGIYFSPSMPVLNIIDCENITNEELDDAAIKEYPPFSAKELDDLAAKAYPMYKIGERVKVLYKSNPRYPDVAEGVYAGVQGGIIKIGTKRIRLRDMEDIEDNMVEIQKFDKELNESLRKEYKLKLERDRNVQRREFTEKNWDSYFNKQLKLCATANEKSGYIYYNGYWQRFDNAMEDAIAGVKENYLNEQQQAAKQRVLDNADAIQDIPQTLELTAMLNPAPSRPNIRAHIQSLKEAQKRAEEMAKIEAEKKREAEAKAAKEAEEAAAKTEETAGANSGIVPQETLPVGLGGNELSNSGHSGGVTSVFIILFILIVIAVIVALGAMFIMRLKKKQDDNRFNKFFEGKGKIQKDFWDMVNESPDTFKYVAYLFPSTDAANSALAKLSYITVAPNGELKCNKDLYFGSYAHHGGAVAFIGGNNFNYAAWREASAVLPELEGAQYFKVSTEPVVNFVPPEVDANKFNIKDEGIEDIQTDDGRYFVCYKYSSDSKAQALDFLNRFNVDESGIMVRVITPEGDFMKTEDGLVEG